MADPSPFRHADADDSPGFLLFKLTSLWQRRLARVFDAFGITQTQYAILASLRWHEEQGRPTTQVGLAEHAHIEPMTLSKAIRKLEADGLVAREPSPADSRAIAVRLTEGGRALAERAVRAIEAADDAFFGRLDAQQLAVYRALVMTLVGGNAE